MVYSVNAFSVLVRTGNVLAVKYKKIRYQGVKCDRVWCRSYKESSVRRERMGHIDLAAPVAHIWYLTWHSKPHELIAQCST